MKTSRTVKISCCLLSSLEILTGLLSTRLYHSLQSAGNKKQMYFSALSLPLRQVKPSHVNLQSKGKGQGGKEPPALFPLAAGEKKFVSTWKIFQMFLPQERIGAQEKLSSLPQISCNSPVHLCPLEPGLTWLLSLLSCVQFRPYPLQVEQDNFSY